MELFRIKLIYEKHDDVFPDSILIRFRPVIGDGIQLLCSDGKVRRFRMIDFEIIGNFDTYINIYKYMAIAKLAEWGDD